MTTTITTPLTCGECGTGTYVRTSPDTATDARCTDCGHHVDTRADIVPHLDAGEFLTYGPTTGTLNVNTPEV